MREHQIVITLKPEQFLQVQKLAKSAGAKSMGMFVRQQLLAALGIEGGSAAKTNSDLQPVVSELKRLHFELKEFVAQSLSAYSLNFDLASETDAVSVETDEALPFVTEDPGFAVENQEPAADVYDEIEASANKTFAISPRLGASEVPDLASAQGFKTESKPAFDPLAFRQAAQQPNEARRDPLADLLDVNEAVGKPKQADLEDLEDETFDVPLSILARRQQLAAQLRAVEEKEKAQAGKEESTANIPPPGNSGDGLDKPDLRDDVKRSAGGQEQKPQTASDQSSSGTYSKYSPLENPDEDSPFSGGPPPKRR